MAPWVMYVYAFSNFCKNKFLLLLSKCVKSKEGYLGKYEVEIFSLIKVVMTKRGKRKLTHAVLGKTAGI